MPLGSLTALANLLKPADCESDSEDDLVSINICELGKKTLAHVACFNLHVACFNLHVACFNLHVACFNLHVACFNLHVACFNLHVTYL